MARIKPTSGTDAWRLICIQLGLLEADELTQTRTEKRAFVGSGEEIIAPVWHGSIASQSAMLALNTSSARGCHRGDFCARSDIGSLAICISNRGEAIGDWTFIQLAGTVEGAGRWEPVTNGNTTTPEIVFSGADGDVVMGWVGT
jgi:hypothetical protein